MVVVNKAHAQRAHARRRAMERYGINLGPASYERLVRLIQRSESYRKPAKVVFVQKRSNRVRLFWVWSGEDGGWLPVVYDRIRKQIVTILPDCTRARPQYVPT